MTAQQTLTTRVTHDAHGAAVIALRGELDLATSPPLGQTLATLVRHEHAVIINLGELTFLDCAGIRTMIAAHHDANARHTRLTLSGAQPFINRVLHMAGADTVLRSRT